MFSQYYVPRGNYKVHRYAQIKIGSRWKKYDDKYFHEDYKIKDYEIVNNILNTRNPLSSKERRIWDGHNYKGKVFSYSPYGDVRHVWEIEYIREE